MRVLATVGLAMAVFASVTMADGPTGASAAFTSDDVAVLRARELLARGAFRDAEQLLPPDADGGDGHAREELRELIRRMRWEYGLSEEALVGKVRTAIPDVAAEDVRRWCANGELQHRVIDGTVWYFRREPSNLFRFSDEAKRRRDEQVRKTTPAAETTPAFVLEHHLAEVIAAAKRSGLTHVLPIRHRVNYSITVPADHPLLKPGATVRAWLPFPQEHDRQREVKLVGTSPAEHLLAPAGTPQRSVYFEQRVTGTGEPVAFRVAFSYVSSAYYPVLEDGLAKPLPSDFAGGNLAERPPHILFTPRLRETVARVVGHETNPLKRARMIFEFVDREIRYCAEEEYCTIPSFSERAVTARRGDCGIQGMLFITMCRAAGIPARWQSGWETKPVNWNMHDWAEFYVEPWGWLPADPSYGLRKSDDPAVRYFYFGHQDAYRLIVNLDYGNPLVPPKRSLRSEPADFQRGEVEIDGRNLYFNEWDWDIKLEWEPLER